MLQFIDGKLVELPNTSEEAVRMLITTTQQKLDRGVVMPIDPEEYEVARRSDIPEELKETLDTLIQTILGKIAPDQGYTSYMGWRLHQAKKTWLAKIGESATVPEAILQVAKEYLDTANK